MKKSKAKDWLEKVMKFEWEGIEWDSKSKVVIPTPKDQKGKVVIR